jgi:hypothetical protein
LELLPPKHPLRPSSAQVIQQADFWLGLEDRLPGILKGDHLPKDAREQLDLGELCSRYKKRYVAATNFYAGAFAGELPLTSPQLAGARYAAACAAALAVAGKGEDAADLADKEKGMLRQKALAWLRDNLKCEAEELDNADAKTRVAIRRWFQHWQQDTDLAGVREARELARLPAAEREAWQQLWAEVAALLKKAQEGTK